MKIKKITMTVKDYDNLTDLVFYGTRTVMNKIYPFHVPVFDEDAGVYTDYSQNKQETTWASIHFMNLVANGIVGIDEDKLINPDDPVTVNVLEISIPAIIQLIHAVYADEKLQKTIWQSRGNDLWESDGHYGSDPKDIFIADCLKNWWIDRQTGRKLIDILESDFSSLTNPRKRNQIIDCRLISATKYREGGYRHDRT